MNRESLVFFLGGYDLEMESILHLLQKHVSPGQIHDHHLAWGARASAYNTELDSVFHEGKRPVLIELTVDRPLPATCILIDHHNERSGADQPTSLEQIFRLLELPEREWTRWHALVAANDRGYLPEMAAMGATTEEMISIRSADRRSQGIREFEEQQAIDAVARRTIHAGGQLTRIDLPHSRTAAAADRMERLLGGAGYYNLIVGTPSSVSFFGEGSLIDVLKQNFPGGWWGGALPERGYWGSATDIERVFPTVIDAINADNASNR